MHLRFWTTFRKGLELANVLNILIKYIKMELDIGWVVIV